MGSSSPPLISCVMPTYGRPAYVDEAVRMFLDQDYPAKELIVLNDCPGQVFRCDLPGVRVVNMERRYGTLGEKRNAAMELANGEIIAVWDDDDVHLPWRLTVSMREMQWWDTPFYRPADFLAFWGEPKLHDNQSVPGWVSHGTVIFTKELWRKVGGYPLQGVGEDAVFFRRIHEELGQEFITHPIARDERFYVLRGTSQYHHMSIGGGQQPLDPTPGDYTIQPAPIRDPVLREACDALVRTYRLFSERAVQPRVEVEDGMPILSVCVSLKNRSRVMHEGRELRLFPRCVRSLAGAAEAFAGEGPVELVVADFHSEDWPLDQWIQEAAGRLQLRIVKVDGDFSRGRGLNVAVEHARSENLFLCDADMLIEPAVLRGGLQVLALGKVFFPVFRYIKPDGSPGAWEHFSYGNAFVTRSVFQAAGGVPEFKSWGGEDDIFRDRVSRQAAIERRQVDGFHHQWHPDRCRHDQYVHRRRSDYEAFRQGQNPNDQEKPQVVLAAVHPHWRGQVHLFPSGRMVRPGLDGGTYELLENERLTLQWDRWPPETLEWIESEGIYRDPQKAFTVRVVT